MKSTIVVVVEHRWFGNLKKETVHGVVRCSADPADYGTRLRFSYRKLLRLCRIACNFGVYLVLILSSVFSFMKHDLFVLGSDPPLSFHNMSVLCMFFTICRFVCACRHPAHNGIEPVYAVILVPRTAAAAIATMLRFGYPYYSW